MKKTIALVAAVCSLNLALAQEVNTNTNTGTKNQTTQKTKPEMMASRHSKHLEKKLGLTADQTQKAYDALLVRFTETEAIREKAGANADKKTLHEQLKPTRQKFVATMNTILTPEQKTKWEAHRHEMKKNRSMRKGANGTTPEPTGNGDIKKLTDDDDGLED